MFRYVELVATTCLSWLLMAGPAWLVAGTKGIQGLSIATAVCFIPGVLFCFVVIIFRKAVTESPLLIMAWSGIRLFFVLGGVLLIRMIRPDLGWKEFLVWLILSYFVNLAIDTWWVIRAVNAQQHQAQQNSELPTN